MQNSQPLIFFHVGLGKAASTFLQYHVFPNFRGIRYIQRTQVDRARTIIEQEGHDRYLLSREYDRQLETEVEKFSHIFPNAQLIIIFRRHGSWIASQYRRWVKNGYPFSFDRYFNLEDTGDVWKTEELQFYKKLEAIEKYFAHKPLVLFYEDMKREPIQFIKSIADLCGAGFDEEAINLNPKHRSYSEKQLLFARKMNRLFYSRQSIHFDSKLLETIRRLLRMVRSYSILFVGKIWPRVEQKPLVPKERLEAIDRYYEEDWKKCQAFARKYNPH